MTPSTIVSARSTSPPKSAWPGVSTMLSVTPSQTTDMFLARIVMPFSRLEVGRVHHPIGERLVDAEGARLAQQRVDQGGLPVVDVGDDRQVAEVGTCRHDTSDANATIVNSDAIPAHNGAQIRTDDLSRRRRCIKSDCPNLDTTHAWRGVRSGCRNHVSSQTVASLGIVSLTGTLDRTTSPSGSSMSEVPRLTMHVKPS